MIRTPEVTAAKLIYFTESGVDPTIEQARAFMAQNGWIEKGSERFVNPQGFRGVWSDFGKGDDVCRATVIEGAAATHVALTVARVTRSPGLSQPK